MKHKPTVILLLALASMLAATAASNNRTPAPSNGISADGGLLDSYFQLMKPQVAVSAKQSGRDGRTSLTVTLRREAVSQYMSSVAPEVQRNHCGCPQHLGGFQGTGCSIHGLQSSLSAELDPMEWAPLA